LETILSSYLPSDDWCRELVDQAVIHEETLSSDPRERVKAVRKICVNFVVLPDKDQAWDDVRRLVEDENSNVRTWAAETIGIAFSYIPDKNRAWKCLLRLSGDDNENVRMDATRALGRAFPHVSDKERAWNDLHQRTEKRADIWVRRGVTEALGYAFPHILNINKEQAWKDLHLLTADHDDWVKRGCAWALGKVFSDLPDKEMAWRDLHRLTRDGYSGVRWSVASALGVAFRHIPDREAAWGTLMRLTKDSQEVVRGAAATSLGLAYPHVTDKKPAWVDIHRFTESDDDSVRKGIAMSLCTAFPYIPDKELAQKDLHGLTDDVVAFVRMWAASSIGIAFQYLPDKQQAWNDLHRLLTEDDDNRVKWKTIEALGQAFPHVPDKARVWSDLHHFVSNEDNMLCVSANHSLGRASIFKAAKANSEDDFKNEMEKALRFFEISAAKASESYNPSKFCLPFYNSFCAVTFNDGDNEAEIERYLGEARVAIRLSESRDVLIEAMEKLAGALKSAQNWEEGQINLNECRVLCDNAANLLVQAEKSAPIAVEVLRRGLPIIGRRIKASLREIEEESSKLREATWQTPFESLGREIHESTLGLADAEYEIEAERMMNKVIQIVRIMCRFLPEGTRKSVEYELRDWEELQFDDKLRSFENAVKYSILQIESLSKEIKDRDDQINYLRKEVITRLDNINYNIFRIKIRSADASDSLGALKVELDKVKDIKSDFDRLERRLEDLDVSQQEALMELNSQMPRLITDLEMLAKGCDDQLSQKILKKLDGLKRSRKETIFERAASLASIVSLLIALV